MKKIKIAVLGKNGQLAKKLTQNLTNTKFLLKNISSKEINFNQKNINFKKILKFKPHIIINCFAYTEVDKSEINKRECNMVNNLSLLSLSKICKENDILLIHFSTDYIFNGKTKKLIDEKQKYAPVNFYGYSKSQGEKKIIKSKCKYLILRIGWTYSEFGKNFLKTVIYCLNRGKKLHIINDQYGCPTSLKMVTDFVEYFILNYDLKAFKSDIVNLCANGYTSWYNYAMIIQKIILRKKKLVYPISSKNYNSIAKRPKFSILDNTKLNKKYKFSTKNWEFYVNHMLKEKALLKL